MKRDFFQEALEKMDADIHSGCKEAMSMGHGYGFSPATQKMIMLLGNCTNPGGSEITIDEKRLASMLASAYYLGFDRGEMAMIKNASA